MVSRAIFWRRLGGALLPLTIATGCAGAPQSGGTPPGKLTPAPPAAGEGFGLYRQAGMLAQSGPIPFVGSVRYFAGPMEDSTIVLVSLSLASRSLMFTQDGNNGERAKFAVGIVARDSSHVLAHVEDEQIVRVASFKETMRGDESVVFERYLIIPPGTYGLSVTVNDRNTGNSASNQISITVPRIIGGSLSSPTTVYKAVPRTRRDTLPDLVANPRATLVFGRDSMAPIYLEAYALPAGARIALSIENPDGVPLLRDTITLTRALPVASAIFDLPMLRIGLGRRTVVATIVGARDTVRTPLWITVGEGIGIVSFDELLSYLRYFATTERLQALRDAPAAQRAAAWYAFWKDTDPNLGTAENEALVDYFERIQAANRQFKEQGEPGWLTDRGKVYITLGEPDEIMGQNGKGLTPSGRSQFWAYSRHGIRLEFVDQNGFGRWRLTQRSESDFEQIASQERAH